MHQARLETESMLATFCRSHDKLFLTVSVRCSSWRASSAIAVASTCGRSGTPYTRLFPESHPPSTHARSRSISTPKWMRFSDSSERLQTVNCSMAMMLKAVGMTQLAEPVTHGQPYLSGSKRTLRSAVLNFHRQSQWPSWPLVLRSQDSPRSRAFDGSPTEFNAQMARAVVHEDSLSPTKDGQLPSASRTSDKSLPSRGAS